MQRGQAVARSTYSMRRHAHALVHMSLMPAMCKKRPLGLQEATMQGAGLQRHCSG